MFHIELTSFSNIQARKHGKHYVRAIHWVAQVYNSVYQFKQQLRMGENTSLIHFSYPFHSQIRNA